MTAGSLAVRMNDFSAAIVVTDAVAEEHSIYYEG